MDTDEDLIERHEGRREQPYKDSLGFWTEGIGHKMVPGDPQGMTEPQIDATFQKDMTVVRAGLDAHIPWWRKLDTTRQAVLEDMAFELGVHGLMEFPKFLAAMEVGDWTEAKAQLQSSLWSKQVPKRAAEDEALVVGSGSNPFERPD